MSISCYGNMVNYMYLRLQGLDDGVVVVDGDPEHAVRVLDRGRGPRATIA